MAPSFEGLTEDNGTYDSEEDVDFSDLREQYDVRLEQGLDAFVVVDGLPVVPEASKAKLITYITKKLNAVGKVKDEGFFMPTNEKGMTEGYGTSSSSYDRSLRLQALLLWNMQPRSKPSRLPSKYMALQ